MSIHTAQPAPPDEKLPDRIPRTSPLHSLHTTLMALVAVALVPVLGMSLFSHLAERDQEQALAVERTAHAAGMIAEDLAQETRMASVLLDIIAANAQVRTCQPSECAKVLDSFARLTGDYQNLFLLLPDGKVLVSTRPIAPGVNMAEDAAFREALKGAHFSVSVSPAKATGGDGAVVTYAAPVRDEQGATRLVLAAQRPLAQASKSILNAGLPAGTSVILAGLDGRVLFRIPDRPGYLGVSLPEKHARLIREQVAETAGWGTGLDGVERYYVLRRLDIGGEKVCYIRVGIPKNAVYAESTEKLGRHLAALVLSTLLVLLLTRVWGGRYILGPVERLMAAVRALGAGDFAARTGMGPKEPGGAGELGELARTVDRLAEGLERGQAQQEASRKALLESEERLRAVFNASADGLLLLVPDGLVLSMNESAARRRNTTPPELIGKNILDLIPAYVRNGRRERYDEVVRTRSPLRFEEAREGAHTPSACIPSLTRRARCARSPAFPATSPSAGSPSRPCAPPRRRPRPPAGPRTPLSPT